MSILKISQHNNIQYYYDFSKSNLPKDVWERIFSHLDAQGVLALSQTHRYLYTISFGDHLWDRFLKKEFSGLPIEKTTHSLREVYKKQTIIRNNLEKGRYRLLHTLESHQGEVSCLLPRGNQLISGSYDRTIKIFDLEKGCELRTLVGHNNYLIGCFLSPGDKLISCDLDGIIKIWDIESGKELHHIATDNLGIVKCVLVHDGKLIIGTRYGEIRIYNLESTQKLQTLQGHQGWINYLLVQNNGNLISAAEDGTIKIWNLKDGREIRTLTCDQDGRGVEGLFMDGNGRLISSIEDDGTVEGNNIVKIWNPENGQELQTFTCPHHTFYRFSACGGNLITGSFEDGTIKVWDLENGRELQTFAGSSNRITSIVFENGRLCTGSDNHIIEIWDFNSPALTPHSEGTLQENLTIHVDFEQIEEKLFEGRLDASHIFARGEAVKDALSALTNTVEQKLIEAKSFDANSNWVGFREKLAKRFTSLTEKCQTPALLANLEEYREIVKETNELIDEFNQLDRSFQELKLRAYADQRDILEKNE